MDRVAALAAELGAVDGDAAIAEIARELETTFVRYATLLARSRPITSIDFYWAGSEIEPWIPSEVMANVYVGEQLALDSTGGFTPIPLQILVDAVLDEPDLDELTAFDDLRARFMARSLELAARAVTIAAAGNAFAALSTARPFRFIATPGHDEREIVLLELR